MLLLTFLFLLKLPAILALLNRVNSAVFCLLAAVIFRGAVEIEP